MEVRILRVGPVEAHLAANFGASMEGIQDEYTFIFEDDRIPLEDIDLSEPVAEPIIEKRVREYMLETGNTELAFGICGCAFPDEIVISRQPDLVLIGIRDWERFSQYPLLTGLMYIAALTLMEEYVDLPVHYETRGCPSDFNNEQREIDIGIKNSEYCRDCKRAIGSAIETRAISIDSVAAIYRIMDHTAQRRMCFVLMPFDPAFDSVYDAVKRATGRDAWITSRSDEIFEAHDIMNIVCSMILRANVIVADLTTLNPNVFYELGYAHARGKTTILLTQDIQSVPFDLRQKRCIVYSPDENGLKRLRDELERYL